MVDAATSPDREVRRILDKARVESWGYIIISAEDGLTEEDCLTFHVNKEHVKRALIVLKLESIYVIQPA
jgi:hypothetical protein